MTMNNIEGHLQPGMERVTGKLELFMIGMIS